MRNTHRLRRAWLRFRHSRPALLAVVVVAALASVATSPADYPFRAGGVEGSFLLSPDERQATVSFHVNTSEAIDRTWDVSTSFGFAVVTLDPSQRSNVRVSLNQEELELTSGYNTFRCEECFTGEDTVTFVFDDGPAPVFIRWYISPYANFDEEVPDDASFDVDWSLDGPAAQTTWISGAGANAAGWEEQQVSAMTAVPLAQGTRAWILYPAGGDPVLVGGDAEPIALAPAGAAEIPLPDACFLGPCFINTELLMNHRIHWALAFTGQPGVTTRLAYTSTFSQSSETTAAAHVKVGHGESQTFEARVTIRDVDPTLVSVVPPRVIIYGAHRVDPEEPALGSWHGDNSVGSMECEGSICEFSGRLTFTAYSETTVDDSLGVTARVEYQDPVAVELEVAPR